MTLKHYWVISQKIAKISFQVQDMGWSSKIKSWPTKYPIWGYAWFYCSCNRKLFMPGCPNTLEVDQSLFREIILLEFVACKLPKIYIWIVVLGMTFYLLTNSVKFPAKKLDWGSFYIWHKTAFLWWGSQFTSHSKE